MTQSAGADIPAATSDVSQLTEEELLRLPALDGDDWYCKEGRAYWADDSHPDGWRYVPPAREYSDRELMAAFRGEFPFPDDIDPVTGIQMMVFEHAGWNIRLHLRLDDLETSFTGQFVCGRREHVQVNLNLIPERHRQHRLNSLQPVTRADWPIPPAQQRELISRIPRLLDIHGWLMCGPPGLGKTTYAAAAVIDAMTAGALQPGATKVFVVNVPDWLPKMQEYDCRDFANENYLQPPEPSIRSITGDADCGVKPILWLEELDDFVPTSTRLGYLSRLIDAVYRANGTIVSTSKMTKSELKSHLGDSIYRRLTGEWETDEERKKWLVWDLHKVGKVRSHIGRIAG